MRPTILTRAATLNCRKPVVLNVVSRRYLTMLSPPKFENEKMVRVYEAFQPTLANTSTS
jgi:1-pyrroline-5-carboxylate dehydrogenase